MARQAVSSQLALFYHFLVLEILVTVLLLNCLYGAKSGWTVCRAVYICGSGEGAEQGDWESAANFRSTEDESQV